MQPRAPPGALGAPTSAARAATSATRSMPWWPSNPAHSQPASPPARARAPLRETTSPAAGSTCSCGRTNCSKRSTRPRHAASPHVSMATCASRSRPGSASWPRWPTGRRRGRQRRHLSRRPTSPKARPRCSTLPATSSRNSRPSSSRPSDRKASRTSTTSATSPRASPRCTATTPNPSSTPSASRSAWRSSFRDSWRMWPRRWPCTTSAASRSASWRRRCRVSSGCSRSRDCRRGSWPTTSRCWAERWDEPTSRSGSSSNIVQFLAQSVSDLTRLSILSHDQVLRTILDHDARECDRRGFGPDAVAEVVLREVLVSALGLQTIDRYVAGSVQVMGALADRLDGAELTRMMHYDPKRLVSWIDRPQPDVDDQITLGAKALRPQAPGRVRLQRTRGFHPDHRTLRRAAGHDLPAALRRHHRPHPRRGHRTRSSVPAVASATPNGC